MSVLLLIPAIVSCLLLAAHFLRANVSAAAVVCLAIPVLLAVRRPWAARVVQVALIIGALEWLRTLIGQAIRRTDADEPWMRMAVILSAVAMWTLLSALAFQTRRLKARYGETARQHDAPPADKA